MANIDVAINGMFFWIMESYMAFRKLGGSGIKEWQRIIEEGLHAGYISEGAVKNSGPEEFLEHVIARDRALGLIAGGQIIDENSFSYSLKDFFLPLKERGVTPREYSEKISTGGYIEAKRKFFVPGYNVKMVINGFRSEDGRSEWVFKKK